MNKPLLGVVLGSILGIFDGLSALLSAPETAPEIVGIVIGSTFKGLLVGLLVGFFARKVNDLRWTLLFGLIVSLFLAWLVAYMQVQGGGPPYYLEIMLPGAILGLIVGYAVQRYGRGARRAEA